VRYLAARPDLDDIALLRCTLMFASPERDEQMARLLGRYGFELVPGAGALPFLERARRFGENIQISLIVLLRNARRCDATRCAGAARGCSSRGARSSSGTAAPVDSITKSWWAHVEPQTGVMAGLVPAIHVFA
jgi:hypothetical protein